jgi:hypothetical protein
VRWVGFDAEVFGISGTIVRSRWYVREGDLVARSAHES